MVPVCVHAAGRAISNRITDAAQKQRLLFCAPCRGGCLHPPAGRRGRRPLQHNPQGFSLPQTSAAAWGQAALHPTLPHSVGRAFARNSFTPPCRGRACPARNLPDTTTCGHRTANPQHAPCPKIALKICRKNQKQPLTIVIHIAIIVKLSRGGNRGKPFYQQLVRVF